MALPERFARRSAMDSSLSSAQSSHTPQYVPSLRVLLVLAASCLVTACTPAPVSPKPAYAKLGQQRAQLAHFPCRPGLTCPLHRAPVAAVLLPYWFHYMQYVRGVSTTAGPTADAFWRSWDEAYPRLFPFTPSKPQRSDIIEGDEPTEAPSCGCPLCWEAEKAWLAAYRHPQ